MQAPGGNAFSDVSVHLTMFKGHGTIRVTAEKFSGYCRGPSRGEGVRVCNGCISLANQELAGAMPDKRDSAVATRAALALQLGSGTVDARLPGRGCQTG